MDSPEERAVLREFANFLRAATDCLPRLTAAVEALAGTEQQSTATRVARKLRSMTPTNLVQHSALRRLKSALAHEVDLGWVNLDEFEIARADLQRLRSIGPKIAQTLMEIRRCGN